MPQMNSRRAQRTNSEGTREAVLSALSPLWCSERGPRSDTLHLRGLVEVTTESAYCTSKGGPGALARAPARELAQRGRGLKAPRSAPTGAAVGVWVLRSQRDCADSLDALVEGQHALHGRADLEEIADCIVLSSSERAASVMETVLAVDGGRRS